MQSLGLFLRYKSIKSFVENKIIVSKKNSLLSNGCNLSKINWMKDITLPLKCKVRIRYNSKGASAKLHEIENNIICEFDEPQLAVTPGQSMVFYEESSIIGGGIIEE